MQCTYAHTHTSVLQMWTIAYRQQLPALPIQAEQHAQGVWRLEGGTGQHTRARAHVRVRLDARNHNNPTRAHTHTHTNTCTETRVWNGDRQAQRELSGDRGDPTRKRENFNVAGSIRWEHSAIEGEHMPAHPRTYGTTGIRMRLQLAALHLPHFYLQVYTQA